MKSLLPYADLVEHLTGHGLTFATPSKSNVEQIASRIRHSQHRARKLKRMRLKLAVLTAEGKL